MKNRNIFGTILLLLGLLVLFVYIVAPFAWITMMSFKTKADIIAVPPKFFFKPTLDNYKILLGLVKMQV